MYRVLVVEDDREIREMVRSLLTGEGYEVLTAGDGATGLSAASYGVDAVILDLGLPALGGFEVLKSLRERSRVPILIVSARERGEDRVQGLEMGADDFLPKPFLAPELIARVRALLRRTQAETEVQAGLVVDRETRRIYLDGRPMALTPREHQLLTALAEAPGKVFSREELYERAWGPEATGPSRQVDHYIAKLRRKLKEAGHRDMIRSVWGTGYRLES